MKSVLLVIFFSIGMVVGARAAEVRDISVIQLIATPERFDGQRVRVIGYLRLEFEGNALYLHREDYENRIWKNGVAMDLTDAQLNKAAKINNGYVMVEGTFSASRKGHLELFQGSLHDISRLAPYRVRRVK